VIVCMWTRSLQEVGKRQRDNVKMIKTSIVDISSYSNRRIISHYNPAIIPQPRAPDIMVDIFVTTKLIMGELF
jgi:hypothetical protein